jgi:2-oxoisovalerate dehydrogenase E1 component
MQEKYGALRVTDTGIREATILGQAIGMAMRGLRPICEIQYLDYMLVRVADHVRRSGDTALAHCGRTGRAGHRAHTRTSSGGHLAFGFVDGGLIHLVRGMNVLVPRDMTRAAGFYNTLLKCDEPAIVIEVLNGYRTKEKLPDNIGEFTVPLGVPEVIREGAMSRLSPMARAAALRWMPRRNCRRSASKSNRGCAVAAAVRCSWQDRGIIEENEPCGVPG